MAALCLWTWSSVLAAPDGRLQLTLFDVGGEALLIRTPTGRNLLINGGPSALRLSNELGRTLPPFQRRLDWLVVAGQRQEQIGALKAGLGRLSASAVAWAVAPQVNGQDSLLFTRARDLGLAYTELQIGQRFELGQGAGLTVLNVGERGAILLLEWKQFRALLPLGLDFEQMERLKLGHSIGRVDLLLLADSGYPPLNPSEWIYNLNPRVVWLAASGEEPSLELLETLQGRTLLRSDSNGWLRVVTDGENIWLQTSH